MQKQTIYEKYNLMLKHIFNRRILFRSVFFGVFMSVILLLIDWKNGVIELSFSSLVNYLLIWLAAGFIIALIQELIERKTNLSSRK